MDQEDTGLLVSGDTQQTVVVVPSRGHTPAQVVIDPVQIERRIKRGESILLQSLGGGAVAVRLLACNRTMGGFSMLKVPEW
jgi:hypothetical protein